MIMNRIINIIINSEGVDSLNIIIIDSGNLPLINIQRYSDNSYWLLYLLIQEIELLIIINIQSINKYIQILILLTYIQIGS